MLVFQPSREEGEGGMGGAQVGWDKILVKFVKLVNCGDCEDCRDCSNSHTEFVKYFYFFVFWGVRGAVCKISGLLGQYPQGNDWSKLTSFEPIFQLCYI